MAVLTPRRALLPAIVALAALLATACAKGPDNPKSNITAAKGSVVGTVTIAAAASLTEPFKPIGEAFSAANGGGVEVKLSFGSSATLVNQIRGGAPADVFASADMATMDRLVSEGLVGGSPRIFARNRLAIIVKKGNPRGIRSLSDLSSAGIVALGGTEVPVGKYADKALASAGVSIVTTKITRGKDVKAVVNAVAEGDADAGIVYATDIAGPRVDAVPIPDAHNQVATYPIAVLKDTQNRPAAEAYVEFVLGAEGQSVLRSAGFMPPT